MAQAVSEAAIDFGVTVTDQASEPLAVLARTVRDATDSLQRFREELVKARTWPGVDEVDFIFPRRRELAERWPFMAIRCEVASTRKAFTG
jgi:hypothetical protein